MSNLYRQRYQYKLLLAREHSTLTGERVTALGKLGFVWDSHTAAWNERFNELRAYQSLHRHCNVPSTSENRTLAVWIKSQRRHHKLYSNGQKSSMTSEREALLQSLGFVWNPRRGPGGES
jgi:Helicase associated domain